MAKNSVKGKQKTAPTPKKDTPNPKEFEKSVIKDMENSKLRIKPWVLKLLGGVFILAGIGFIIYPLISDRVSINLPDVFDRNEEVAEENNDDDEDDENDNSENEDSEDSEDSENSDDESDGDKDSTNENSDEDEDGKIAGGNSTRRDDSTTETAQTKSTQIQTTINQTGVWRATDYVKGDISAGTYQVKLGDTLWEIAEAVYGDGAQWTTILANNSDSIGFLPDGSQALIVPGQFLTIE